MSTDALSQTQLSEMLVTAGVISADQLKIALMEQKKQNQPLNKLLIKLGFISEIVMRDFLSKSYRQASVDLKQLLLDAEAIQMIPQTFARRYNILPLNFNRETKTLTVAMIDIFNVMVLDRLSAELGGSIKIKPLLASETEILNALDSAYGFDLSLDGILREIETGEIDYQSLSNHSQGQYNQPLVRLVDALLTDAVKKGASDIHFEPEQSFLRIRYRIDGVLQQVHSLHQSYWSAIVVRIKVMAELNIAENRTPQDGRFTMTLSGRPIDFRVSTLPTVHGENIVLRILDREKGIVSLQELGLPENTLHTLHLMMARPEGLILVTGPTGSGKTTTLYSILNHLNREEINIMTLEEPVEYHLNTVRQTSINEAVKLDFVQGVRAILRQDPDIILIGEIRDEETADMALRAAMTGHQVYATLHTNSAVGAIPRLLDLGVLPDLLADNIIGIIGQRLVRKLCPYCRQSYDASNLEKNLLNVNAEKPLILYRSKGCIKCNERGYKGRMALMEILRINPDIEALIAQRSNIYEIKKYVQSTGFKSLAHVGMQHLLNGTISLEELSRVVDLTAHL
jgi:type II secretory ATPase GspE/PulE/Tfp pilus assembly ATPase PilB-like protein